MRRLNLNEFRIANNVLMFCLFLLIPLGCTHILSTASIETTKIPSQSITEKKWSFNFVSDIYMMVIDDKNDIDVGRFREEISNKFSTMDGINVRGGHYEGKTTAIINDRRLQNLFPNSFDPIKIFSESVRKDTISFECSGYLGKEEFKQTFRDIKWGEKVIFTKTSTIEPFLIYVAVIQPILKEGN